MITWEQLYVCILFIHMYCTLRVLCKNKKICLTDMTCSVTLSLRWINKCIATCFVSSRALITSGIFLGHIPKVKVNSNSCSIYPCSRQLTKLKIEFLPWTQTYYLCSHCICYLDSGMKFFFFKILPLHLPVKYYVIDS